MHRLQELVRLHRMGTGAREVARLLGMSPNTERTYRKVFKSAELLSGPVEALPELSVLLKAVSEYRPQPRPGAHETSSIEDWAPRIEALVKKGLTARPIFDRLRQEEEAFRGSYWAVKRLCRRIRRAQGVHAEDVAIPVETVAGEVAQVDFGYVGRLICPDTHVPRRAWVFVMTLGYSRHIFAEVVFNQKIDTWIGLHVRSFEYLKGVPQVVVPDNLKSAVIRAAFGVDGDSELNRSYRELARYYGFKVDPTPPRAPRKKGKVESSVKYVKRNALAGRDTEDLHDVNQALARWVEEIAGTRLHGTTGKAPLRVFQEEEQGSLLSLPAKRYEVVIWRKAKVHQDCLVAFQGRLYSVWWRWIGQQVWIRATPTTVAIELVEQRQTEESEDRPVVHRRTGKGRAIIEAHLPEHRRDRRHRSQSYWEERAAKIGPETARLAQEIFESDEVLCQLRKVQAIVTHLEGFPLERAEAASARACFYGSYTYRSIKSILSRALDREPLPQAILPSQSDEPPRFARSIEELVRTKLEVIHEPH